MEEPAGTTPVQRPAAAARAPPPAARGGAPPGLASRARDVDSLPRPQKMTLIIGGIVGLLLIYFLGPMALKKLLPHKQSGMKITKGPFNPGKILFGNKESSSMAARYATVPRGVGHHGRGLELKEDVGDIGESVELEQGRRMLADMKGGSMIGETGELRWFQYMNPKSWSSNGRRKIMRRNRMARIQALRRKSRAGQRSLKVGDAVPFKKSWAETLNPVNWFRRSKMHTRRLTDRLMERVNGQRGKRFGGPQGGGQGRGPQGFGLGPQGSGQGQQHGQGRGPGFGQGPARGVGQGPLHGVGQGPPPGFEGNYHPNMNSAAAGGRKNNARQNVGGDGRRRNIGGKGRRGKNRGGKGNQKTPRKLLGEDILLPAALMV